MNPARSYLAIIYQKENSERLDLVVLEKDKTIFSYNYDPFEIIKIIWINNTHIGCVTMEIIRILPIFSVNNLVKDNKNEERAHSQIPHAFLPISKPEIVKGENLDKMDLNQSMNFNLNLPSYESKIIPHF